MTNAFKTAALFYAAVLSCGTAYAAKTVPGWPLYLAMGAVGGPNITPPTINSRGQDDDFGGRPVDVVFKYAGANGNGDPGMIDPPTNATRMTGDINILSGLNGHAMRVAIVEYTAQMSGGFALADFSNSPDADPASGGTYLMARHFISLAADTIALNDMPVAYDGGSYYGTQILNPDLMGAIQQGGFIGNVDGALPTGAVNQAVDQALCFLTATRSYFNTSNPNGLQSAPYLDKNYTGTPVSILEQLLADTYPVWSINSAQDPYWNTATDNRIGGTGGSYAQVGQWFNACVAHPKYNRRLYRRPDFPAGFEGWVQANNWLIRTFSPVGQVTFGWQDNMWAVGSGFWLHADLTRAEIASTYSRPLSDWLKKNAPSAVKGADYFVFDRYETDDSAAPGQAALYNARAWDNYLTAVGQVSARFDGAPIMLWQIPGSHIPYKGEADPEYYNDTPGLYVFSTAPDYFFGDRKLKPDLSNIVAGSGSTTNAAVGNYAMDCNAYRCAAGSTYRQYLTSNGFDWGRNNRTLASAAAHAHVFAILWGGGNTTNVIKNFSNTDDHGWLAAKIVDYYRNPVAIPTN
ncbi:MAG: hypothetical protein JOZ72_10275 [Alphaproteobacteria bacterium]|nr:hypothetical protein [Alphaproteobacteria bacterium]